MNERIKETGQYTLTKGCPVSTKDTVITLDISATDYSFSEINTHWASMLVEVVCAACGTKGHYAPHGSYRKYYYHEKARIFRVRCRRCGQTHAVIPSFPLPGTSIGTVEAEE